MQLLQRKIFIETVQVFILTLFVILCLILMGRALQLRELLFGLELSLTDTLLLFVYMSPTFLQLAAPISCMLAIFIVFLRLESDREMIALKAGGVSLYQLLLSPILFALCAGLMTLFLAFYGISWGMNNFRNTIIDVATNRAKIVIQAGVFNKDIPGFVLYAKQVDPISGFMSQVLVQDSSLALDDDAHTNENNTFDTTILAPEGHIDTDREKGDLLFLLKNGKIYSSEHDSSNILRFREYIVRIPLNNVFSGLDLGPIEPKEMSFEELLALSPDEVRQKSEKVANKLIIERHKRLVFPFACFVLGLLSIPMSIACAGVNKQQGLGLALLLFIVYYGFLSTGISIGEKGKLDPYIGIWLPNLFFIIVAMLGIRHYANAITKG